MSTSLLFNPLQASIKELESTFVGRHELLDKFEKELLNNCRAESIHHWQIIGPRGSGKSHTTELLVSRMNLHHGWRVARLPEENYQVSSLGELLEQILIRSEERFGTSPLAETTDDLQLQQRALNLLKEASARSKKPLLVVLENLTTIFDRLLRTVHDEAKLRDILTNDPPFILIATSTSYPDAAAKHSTALYELFHTLVLDDLTQADITQLIRARADWEKNAFLLANFERVKGRIKAVYHLSGGNPRLALALYRIIQQGVTVELHDQIMKLLDEVTPYYQARLNDIPPQAARVLTEMAVSERIAAPAEIARRCRIPTNQVTAQIRKLLDERLVVQGGKPDGRSRLYELKDRLLRIWLQMRESAGGAKRLRFLVEFFEHWYADRTDEFEQIVRRTVSDLWGDLATGDERKCVDHLKMLSYLAEVRPSSGGTAVLRALSRKVEESNETDIRAHIDSLQKTFELSSDLTEREALAFSLAECFVALNSEADAQRTLKMTIDEGSHNQAIAAKYASALIASGAYLPAWTFGTEWLQQHPDHDNLALPLAIAACAIGEFDKGFDFLKKCTSPRYCYHCTEQALRRTLNVLRAQNAAPDVQLTLWKRFVGVNSHKDVTSDQIEAVFQVLSEEELPKIPSASFMQAADAWHPLSTAPLWLFGKAICGLAHRPGGEVPTLRFIIGIAERTSHPLTQFALDHLIDILPALRHRRSENAAATEWYLKAMSLVRTRTTPKSLSRAFRSNAPAIAKKFKNFVTDLIELYKEWLQEGLLEEAITPYSEVVSVLSTNDYTQVLQSLHPENRDAVVLLLKAMNIRANERKVWAGIPLPHDGQSRKH